MNIQKINNMPKTSFRGQIITTGAWDDEDTKKSFMSNSKIKRLSKKHTVIAEMKSHSYSAIEGTLPRNEKLYKLKLTIKKDSPSFLDKIKNLLSLNTTNVTRNYHSADGMYNIIENTGAIRKAIRKFMQ